MELKPQRGTQLHRNAFAFNRTSMELKQVSVQSSNVDSPAFNRTSMELKLGLEDEFRDGGMLF